MDGWKTNQKNYRKVKQINVITQNTLSIGPWTCLCRKTL